MDAAAGIRSGEKEGRGGPEMEAGVAEGMAELTKKDHSYCYGYVYPYVSGIRIVQPSQIRFSSISSPDAREAVR